MFLSGGLTEMKVHLGVEASHEALLFGLHVVVKVSIEVRESFISNIAGLHAVVEDDPLCAVIIHVTFSLSFVLVADTSNLHGLLSSTGVTE